MSADFIVRMIEADELDECIKLFQQTVHHVSAKDYTMEQLNAWAPLVAPSLLDNYSNWESLLRNITYVAVYNNKIIGFGEMTRAGYLDRLFVDKDFQGQSVATAIFHKLATNARQYQICEITTHASISAKAFFEKMGFTIIEEEQKLIRNVMLINYLMKKTIE